MPPETFRLRPGTVARPEVLDEVQDLLSTVWSAHPEVSTTDRMCVETAAVEVAANIVEHAGGAGEVGMAVVVAPERVEVCFHDTGAWFDGDLQDVALPDDMAERGRGLALAGTLSELTYERDGDTNRWRLVRRRAE